MNFEYPSESKMILKDNEQRLVQNGSVNRSKEEENYMIF